MYYDQKESGKRIAALRKEKGLTQEQLAEKLNISTSTLGKIERGIQGFSIDLLIEIGIFFGISTDYIYQIVDLLVDTCSTKRKMLRIAGDDKPAEVVRSRFMKLNADHIRFVLKCLAENSSPIRNMKQYLLASLYNAPTTMQLSYQNQTNHDLAMRR